MVFETNSAEETKNIGFKMGQAAKSGEIYCLSGDLGVGKTIFTQGFAKGAGVTEEYITSPTFAIVNEYEGRIKLYHFDVYRIGSIEEMDDTGYEEYFFGNGVCLVEWAENIKEIIPQEATWITIEKDLLKGVSYRRIVIGDEKRENIGT